MLSLTSSFSIFEQYYLEQMYLSPLSLCFFTYKMGKRVVLPHRIVGLRVNTYKVNCKNGRNSPSFSVSPLLKCDFTDPPIKRWSLLLIFGLALWLWLIEGSGSSIVLVLSWTSRGHTLSHLHSRNPVAAMWTH